jgi:hypothetical protein
MFQSIEPPLACQSHNNFGVSVSQTIPSEYVQGLDQVLSELADVVFGKSPLDLKDEDHCPILLALDLWEPSEGVSIWLGCYATESLRKSFDSKVEAVHKTLMRIARTQAYLERLSPPLRASPRAAEILGKWTSVLSIHGAELHSLWSTLKRCYNISGSPTPHAPTAHLVEDSLADYKRLFEYAQKQWNPVSHNYILCESIANGPGKYGECVEKLLPRVNKSTQTRLFHAVLGPLNKTIGGELGLRVYRPTRSQQILVERVEESPNRNSKTANPKRSTKKTSNKKSATKRKR